MRDNINGWRVVSVNERAPGFEGAEWMSYWDGHEIDCCRAKHCLPDLSDPCTLGGLVALVRGAWGRPYAHVAKAHGGPWILCDIIGQPLHTGLVDTGEVVGGDTEAEALVAALEAAPETP